MDEFLEQGDTFVLPDNFPQARTVVEEQLKVLKSLKKSTASSSGNANKKSSDSTESVAGNSSKSQVFKKSEKKTCFKPMENKSAHKKSNMQDLLEKTSPYNLFFTKIPDSPATLVQENSITFTG